MVENLQHVGTLWVLGDNFSFICLWRRW